MKDVAEINVVQVRIYGADRIPFQELSAGKNPELLRDALQFRELQPDGRGLAFTNGLFAGPLGATVVTGLSVDPRRILLRVRGHSAQADAVHRKVWEVLESMTTSRVATPEDAPLILTQESTCIATLEIGFDQLVAPALLKLLRDQSQSLLKGPGEVKSIDFQSLTFNVGYDSERPFLQQRGIALVNKQLTIQPRAGTPLSEKRFFISSPTDSETLLKLVSAFEAELRSKH